MTQKRATHRLAPHGSHRGLATVSSRHPRALAPPVLRQRGDCVASSTTPALTTAFEDEVDVAGVKSAISKKADEIGWNEVPRPAPTAETIYRVVRRG